MISICVIIKILQVSFLKELEKINNKFQTLINEPIKY